MYDDFYVLVCNGMEYAMKLHVLVTASMRSNAQHFEKVTFILPQAAGESLLQEIRKVWPVWPFGDVWWDGGFQK